MIYELYDFPWYVWLVSAIVTLTCLFFSTLALIFAIGEVARWWEQNGPNGRRRREAYRRLNAGSLGSRKPFEPPP